ncbi:sensor histidine kinase [Streptomyces sp. NPDC019396]|uniref:sensor histidine kinase n=1 Tax=Streptomyces sp. NPDC019396 TaxID=3154687 RepID=UPI0033E78559
MSADLQVEEPPRRMTMPMTRRGARDTHIWDRTSRTWDFYYAAVWLATMTGVYGAGSPGLRYRIAALVLLTLMVPWYLLAGRPRMLSPAPDDDTAAVLYLAGVVLLFLVPASLVGETRVGTFALAPQCFMLLSPRRAMGWLAVINLVPVAGWSLFWRPPVHLVVFNVLFAIVSLAFSGFFGVWIDRIITQSRERASLIAELEASRGEVARLSAERGALTERERMSREIHDTLAQGFTSLLMLVQAVQSELGTDPAQARKHLELMAVTARQNLAEARALVAGGAPADLDGGSLPDAVSRLAARHDPPAAVTVTGEARPLPAALEVVALRTCQEALANAAKHAGPGAGVALSLDYDDHRLTVAVRDTGRGFDPAVPSQGYGLPGLRARAAEVGGTAEIASTPGEGTTVTVTLRSRS